MTVGFHSPLPPARTGVADYSAKLLQQLRKHGKVETGARSADVHLYHLGNNQVHRKIYARAMARPGVVVLHDAVLHHFYLGAFDRDRYVEEFVYNYGEWERPLAEELWLERAGSGMDFRYFDRPMLRRVAERSLCIVVHNCAAAQMVRRHAPNAQVVEIPHFFDSPETPNESERLCMRRRWGADEGACVFGIFGYLRESKRIEAACRAFERLHVRHSNTRLLLAGSWASPDLARAVEPWLSHPGVIRSCRLAERQFQIAAEAVDCCLNLRSPGAGETSGIGVRLMGIGKPVIFTDGPEISFVPQDCCFRVSAGIAEAAELFEYMNTVVEQPTISRAIGERAAGHIRRCHSIERVCERYWNTLCASAAPPSFSVSS